MTTIKEFKEKDRITQNLLVKSCTKGVTSKGAPYLNIQLQDASGTIEGKFWDVKPEEMEAVIIGHVEQITAEVLEYNHNLQLRISNIMDIAQDSIDLSAFIRSSQMSEAEQKTQIHRLIQSLQNKNLKTLVSGMYRRVADQFFEYPAASRIHHNYRGGLAEHTLGMCALAEAVAGLYPLLDRDLLIAGVLCHDLGKTAELGGLVSADYTEEGRLIGHISIGHGWLMEVAEEEGLSDSEEAILLRHMILSHHGKMEFGSPVMPAIPEAEILFLIDNMDARMNTLKQVFDGMKSGSWSQRIFALDNRMFYKRKESA